MDGLVTFRIKTREIRADRLVIGSSSRADLRLDDPIAAAAHCTLSVASGRLRVIDLDTATGTYVDGIRVPPGGVEVATPCELVLGASRVLIDRAGDKVTLQPRERSFCFQEPSRGENAADRSEWSFSELELGRMRFLGVCNRAAVLLAVAFCAALVMPAFREPMISPGSLTRGHASLFVGASDRHAEARRLAKADGCSVCHEPGNGTPVNKCAQCHGDLIANQHPFADDHARGRLAGVSSSFDDEQCSLCHLEHALHGESDRDPLNAELTTRAKGLCLECHASTMVGRQIEDAMAAGTDGGSGSGPIDVKRPIASVPPGEPRPVSTVGFGHDDHVARDVDRDGVADVDIPCSTCHLPTEATAATDPRREFAPVPFETCARCHVRGREDRRGLETQWAAWEKVLAKGPDGTTPAFLWEVDWHGSDDPARCHRCHDSIEERQEWHRAAPIATGPSIDQLARSAERAGLRRVTRRVREPGKFDPRRALYDVPRRDHAEYFEAPTKRCAECHVDGAITVEARPEPKPFLHFMHLSQDPVSPGPADRAAASAECLSCHRDRKSSEDLTDLALGRAFAWISPAACPQCHRDRDDKPLSLKASDAHDEIGPPAELRSLPDFPHGPHVPGTGDLPAPAARRRLLHLPPVRRLERRRPRPRDR